MSSVPASPEPVSPEPVSPDPLAPEPVPGRSSFRVAIAPGVNVGSWSRVWAERQDVPLEVVPRDGGHVEALRAGTADVAFVRLPVDTEGLHVIPLWTEVAVVVVPRDHPVALFDEVTVADLVDEDLVQDPDDVPQWRDAAAAARTAPLRPPPPAATAADAVELVAAGLGVLVVPMSVARLHHRKDVTHRPVVDVDHTQIALVWPADRTTSLVEEWVGVVRGRTAHSSRGGVGGAATPDESARDAGRTPRGPAAGGAAQGRSGAPQPSARRGSARARGGSSRRGRRR
ncbi:LysR family substrate-binding domain-containing protein [Actinotalea solisilvae]|uniref:LysR family substrate-binding domain-containing protein n=1 Tax=Actinotalea solisilvae TaxID=2072922 RepID=UPI0027DB338C|nr:LysR substrate-binding domain-containing protein [Actinotalea solisilvae]